MMMAMPVFRSLPLCLVVSVAACDGATATSTPADGGVTSDGGATLNGPAPALANSPGYGGPPKLTLRVLAGRGNGQEVSPDAMLAALRTADAVCLGETHDSYAVHSTQLLLVDRLRQVGSTVDPAWAMGFEMFQRPFQSTMDDFQSGRIAEGTFRTNSQYDTRWGFEWDLYRPLVLHGIAHGHPLRALNAEKELSSRVSSVGIAALTPIEQATLPELVLTNEAHRAWFRDAIAAGHMMLTDERFDAMYTVQVLWDETMADTAALWLKVGPKRHMAIIAGRGHCVDWAIPDRLRRRGVAKVVNLQIVEDTPGAAESAVLIDPMDFVVAATLRADP